MEIQVNLIIAYALIFIRVSGIFFALPIFGDAPTPIRVRIFLSFAVTICVVPSIEQDIQSFAIPVSIAKFFGDVIKELAIGLIIGFVAKLAFEGLIMGASLVGYQMGFGTADLIMPDSANQMNSFTAMHRVFMIMFFFVLNMHHSYILAISETFKVIPLLHFEMQKDVGILMISLTSSLFVTALQLAAPLLVALMFAMGTLGIVARAVPQVNVFVVSFPISFFVGLLIYIATLPLMPSWLEEHFAHSSEQAFSVMHGLHRKI